MRLVHLLLRLVCQPRLLLRLLLRLARCWCLFHLKRRPCVCYHLCWRKGCRVLGRASTLVRLLLLLHLLRLRLLRPLRMLRQRPMLMICRLLRCWPICYPLGAAAPPLALLALPLASRSLRRCWSRRCRGRRRLGPARSRPRDHSCRAPWDCTSCPEGSNSRRAEGRGEGPGVGWPASLQAARAGGDARKEKLAAPPAPPAPLALRPAANAALGMQPAAATRCRGGVNNPSTHREVCATIGVAGGLLACPALYAHHHVSVFKLGCVLPQLSIIPNHPALRDKQQRQGRHSAGEGSCRHGSNSAAKLGRRVSHPYDCVWKSSGGAGPVQ